MSKPNAKTASRQASGLLTCIPADRRAEVATMLRESPELKRYLDDCKRGLIDCWETLRRLGLNPGQWNSPVVPTDSPPQCWGCNFYSSQDKHTFRCWYDTEAKDREQFTCPFQAPHNPQFEGD